MDEEIIFILKSLLLSFIEFFAFATGFTNFVKNRNYNHYYANHFFLAACFIVVNI